MSWASCWKSKSSVSRVAPTTSVWFVCDFFSFLRVFLFSWGGRVQNWGRVLFVLFPPGDDFFVYIYLRWDAKKKMEFLFFLNRKGGSPHLDWHLSTSLEEKSNQQFQSHSGQWRRCFHITHVVPSCRCGVLEVNLSRSSIGVPAWSSELGLRYIKIKRNIRLIHDDQLKIKTHLKYSSRSYAWACQHWLSLSFSLTLLLNYLWKKIVEWMSWIEWMTSLVSHWRRQHLQLS